ncbi:hypothetical protein [Formosa sp. S-31]|uniref:hypothetical protein n=1 Tax=Formosa sp. S-31 TaxID=2790949 RepID=UPI003EBCD671
MKRKILITVFFSLLLTGAWAQWTPQKTGIDMTNENYTTNSGGSLNIVKEKNKPETPNFVVVESDVQVPVSYESKLYSSYSRNSLILDDDYMDENLITFSTDLYNTNSVGGKSEIPLQNFTIFTIINTNDLQVSDINEDSVKLGKGSEKFLPKNFDPYKGMFSDKINAETMLNPITAY